MDKLTLESKIDNYHKLLFNIDKSIKIEIKECKEELLVPTQRLDKNVFLSKSGRNLHKSLFDKN